MLDFSKNEFEGLNTSIIEGLNTSVLESILGRKNKSKKAQSRILEIRQIIEELKNEEIDLKNIIRTEEQEASKEFEKIFLFKEEMNSLDKTEFDEIVTSKNPFTRKELITSDINKKSIEENIKKEELVEKNVISEINKTNDILNIKEEKIINFSLEDNKEKKVIQTLVSDNNESIKEIDNILEEDNKEEIQVPSFLIKNKQDNSFDIVEENINEEIENTRFLSFSKVRNDSLTVKSFLEISNKTPMEKIENFESFLNK